MRPFFAACLLVAVFATEGAAQEHERESLVGIVDQVQLIDASSMGGGRELLLHLETGEAFRFPRAEHVAAGAGVKVRIHYREGSGGGELMVACSAEVLALPLDEDSDEPMQKSSQPFEVYRNPDC